MTTYNMLLVHVTCRMKPPFKVSMDSSQFDKINPFWARIKWQTWYAEDWSRA